MSVKTAILFVLFLNISQYIKAQNSNSALLGAAKAWWHAVTVGDTTYIKDNSTDELTVTFNNGRSFTRKEIIYQVGSHDPFAKITSEWSDIKEQKLTPQTAIITNKIVEKIGAMSHTYKFITVIVKAGPKWKIAAAQSTRELSLAPRIPLSEAGKLEDYVGEYRTPAGMTLKIIIKDTSLVMVEPSGAENKLEPVGPSLFELSYMPFAGNVRFVFYRDAEGKVKSFTRLAHVITTMTRIK
jgi:hypothetical protein